MRRSRKKYISGKKNIVFVICIGMLTGMIAAFIPYYSRFSYDGNNALSNKEWYKVKMVIEKKIGIGYYEIGMCTGFLYWCLDNAYNVNWGENSRVIELEKKLIDAGIEEVTEDTSGKITKKMKPGDIIIFIDGEIRTHCAILGDKGNIYHADSYLGVRCGPTLEEWMELPHENRNCDRYKVYRGLSDKI